MKPNIDRISLHPICKANNVTMETVLSPADPAEPGTGANNLLSVLDHWIGAM
jgi:hypothetical protein